MARILVVDDEEEFLRGICRCLRIMGHDVEEAASGLTALAILGERSVDLVLTDINMPDMDGFEVVAALREARPEIRVVAMSGGGRVPGELLLEDAGVLGAVSTIAKPFELSELQATVEGALAGEIPG